jgi:hypothetical protein
VTSGVIRWVIPATRRTPMMNKYENRAARVIPILYLYGSGATPTQTMFRL